MVRSSRWAPVRRLESGVRRFEQSGLRHPHRAQRRWPQCQGRPIAGEVSASNTSPSVPPLIQARAFLPSPSRSTWARPGWPRLSSPLRTQNTCNLTVPELASRTCSALQQRALWAWCISQLTQPRHCRPSHRTLQVRHGREGRMLILTKSGRQGVGSAITAHVAVIDATSRLTLAPGGSYWPGGNWMCGLSS